MWATVAAQEDVQSENFKNNSTELIGIEPN